MKTLSVTLLLLGAVIITQAITRYHAFFDFSPNAASETAGFIAFRTMLGSLGFGLVVICLSAVCFLTDYLIRRERRNFQDGQDKTNAA
jgi:hypothetical protein